MDDSTLIAAIDIMKNDGNHIRRIYISNYYYDGDTASVKGVYTVESNEELIEHIESKSNYVTSSAINGREWSNEATQMLYSLTKVLKGTELDKVEF